MLCLHLVAGKRQRSFFLCILFCNKIIIVSCRVSALTHSSADDDDDDDGQPGVPSLSQPPAFSLPSGQPNNASIFIARQPASSELGKTIHLCKSFSLYRLLFGVTTTKRTTSTLPSSIQYSLARSPVVLLPTQTIATNLCSGFSLYCCPPAVSSGALLSQLTLVDCSWLVSQPIQAERSRSCDEDNDDETK